MSPTILTDDAIFELPEEVGGCQSIPSHMTEDEFAVWAMQHEKTRVEWVDGEVISMSPVSARHVRICLWLDRTLGTYVQSRDLGEVLGSEFAVRLRAQDRISRRCPDLMFVRKDRLHLVLKNHLEGAPDLAVEIVSPDSVQRDWTEKVVEYEQAGVREYWIIDPQAERFEAFALEFTVESGGKFVPLYDQPKGTFASQVLQGFRMDVEWLWAENLPKFQDIWRGLGVMD